MIRVMFHPVLREHLHSTLVTYSMYHDSCVEIGNDYEKQTEIHSRPER